MPENLKVEMAYLYAEQNSENHKTDKFEMVHDEENPIPVLRRGMKFTMALAFDGGAYDKDTDFVRLLFNFGRYQQNRILENKIYKE